MRGRTSSSTITNFIFRKLLQLLQAPGCSSTSNTAVQEQGKKAFFTLDGCGVSQCLVKKQPRAGEAEMSFVFKVKKCHICYALKGLSCIKKAKEVIVWGFLKRILLRVSVMQPWCALKIWRRILTETQVVVILQNHVGKGDHVLLLQIL